MDPLDHRHQAPPPQWSQPVESAEATRDLRRRIDELEQQVETYEALLRDLPELFERKFQQRSDPLIERYRLLAEQTGQPALLNSDTEPAVGGNVVRFPSFRLPAFLKRQRSV